MCRDMIKLTERVFKYIEVVFVLYLQCLFLLSCHLFAIVYYVTSNKTPACLLMKKIYLRTSTGICQSKRNL
jgi:hypothetical protein